MTFSKADFEQKNSQNRLYTHPPMFFHCFFNDKIHVTIKE